MNLESGRSIHLSKKEQVVKIRTVLSAVLILACGLCALAQGPTSPRQEPAVTPAPATKPAPPPEPTTLTPKDSMVLQKFSVEKAKNTNLEWNAQAQQFYNQNILPKLQAIQAEQDTELRQIRQENGWPDSANYDDHTGKWTLPPGVKLPDATPAPVPAPPAPAKKK